MWNNPHTEQAVILQLVIQKDKEGNVTVSKYNAIPTMVRKQFVKGKQKYSVVPIQPYLDPIGKGKNLSINDQEKFQQAWNTITSHMKKGKPH